MEFSDILALFGTAGFLEIAINIGNAKKLLNMNVGDALTVNFYDKKSS
ncbi:MAG: SAM hydroxide adenosyltransferase [Flavobacteriales bacterium]